MRCPCAALALPGRLGSARAAQRQRCPARPVGRGRGNLAVALFLRSRLCPRIALSLPLPCTCPAFPGACSSTVAFPLRLPCPRSPLGLDNYAMPLPLLLHVALPSLLPLRWPIPAAVVVAVVAVAAVGCQFRLPFRLFCFAPFPRLLPPRRSRRPRRRRCRRQHRRRVFVGFVFCFVFVSFLSLVGFLVCVVCLPPLPL